MRGDDVSRTGSPGGESSFAIFGEPDGHDAEYPDYHDPDYHDADAPPPPSRHASGRRAERHHASRSKRARRRGRLVALVALVVIVVVVAVGFVIVKRVAGDLGTKNYSGDGSGTVLVQVHAGDATADIASTLVGKDVVASKQAFVDAARASGQSQDFQPGFFNLHLKMSGKAAVALLLDPNSRVSDKVTIPEGMTTAAILVLLAAKLKLPIADLKAAAADVANLGVPDGFATKTAEGFLFPSTYDFDPGTTSAEALQQLTAQFQAESRTLNFAAGAKTLGYSEYQVLTVASLVEAESFFDEDRAKVARVVYNRLKAKMPLGFDSTSAYGAKLIGQDPKTIDYTKAAPYNTRNTPGLPPTPIDNPGAESLTAAVTPAAGNWLYFVNKDKAGHLFFTNDYNAFVAAAQKCHDQGWGCDSQK